MIGWYIHHHGRGHLDRALAVAAHVPHPITFVTSLPEETDRPANVVEWVTLPLDTDGDVAGADTARMTAIAAWVGRARPLTFVVDVSAEVAVLVRSLGLPTVVVAMPGDRSDPAHQAMYDAASLIVAPWAAALYQPTWLVDPRQTRTWGRRVRYVGGVPTTPGAAHHAEQRTAGAPRGLVSLAAGLELEAARHARPARHIVPAGSAIAWGGAGGECGEGTVLVLAGRGGSDRLTSWWRPGDCPGWTVLTAGPGEWRSGAELDAMAQRADVVVTAAGQGSVANLAGWRSRAVVVPQERPHDEQTVTGRLLAQRGLAQVVTAPPDDWSGVLAAASRQDPRSWWRWGTRGAAERFAWAVRDVLYASW